MFSGSAIKDPFGPKFGPVENKGSNTQNSNGAKIQDWDRTKKSPNISFGSIQTASSLYRLIFRRYYPYSNDIGPL